MTVASKLNQTLASLKGIKSTLKIYSIQEQKKESKDTYEKSLLETNDIIEDLENRIKVLELEEPQYKSN
ncbi:Protein of uncharacterised function (DUF1657) [Clostridium putrefaciens]|uniref:Protein of uncharacterized function (DUF1657) n=1 Tax=Clostridium putrefaciens TaxID=99675 RepID=A0A381J4T2_9CLOT|nr:DUF1657 domain-containing protein [Clostridium putrefaciens]SUY45457.1 Protein of uncharacterised function (DUF1657) [Clostridium putrefaciens]